MDKNAPSNTDNEPFEPQPTRLEPSLSSSSPLEQPKVAANKEPLPPFPDRSITSAFWISLGLGLIGLDHFYLRSPTTGVWKALTFGGLGIWWLWDVLQLAFEKERTALYGLTAPFNLAAGIGQGQISIAPTHIQQRTDYFNWFLSAFLDIFGITALLEGRPAAFLRRLIDGVLLIAFASTGTLFGYLMAAIFAFFTIVPAFFTLRAIFSPEALAKKGVNIPQNLVKLLNFFESWTDIIGPNATAVVRSDFGLSAVDPNTAPHTFGYANEEELAAEKEAAAAAAKQSGKSKELTSWPVSMLLGNVFGGLVLSIVNLFSFIPTVKMGLLAADGYFGAVRLSRGETPEIPNLAGFLPPGLGALAQKATQAGALLEKAKEAASVMETVRDVAQNPEKLVGTVLEQGQSALEGKASGFLQKGEEALQQKVSGAQEKASGFLEAGQAALKGKASNILHTGQATLEGKASQLLHTGLGKATPRLHPMKGGARSDQGLSTESLVLGTTVIALIAGGAIKMTVEYLVDG